MKKSLSLLLLLLPIVTYSQTERGTLMLGGSAGISKNKNTISFPGISNHGNTSFAASFSPNVGYFITDRFAAGVIFSFSMSETESNLSEIDSRHTSFALGPTLRYYFTIGEKWAAFPTISYVYQTTVFRGSQFNPNVGDFVTVTEKTKDWRFGAGGGITHFITRSVGIEGLLLYQRFATTTNNSSSGGLAFNLGFQIYFSQPK